MMQIWLMLMSGTRVAQGHRRARACIVPIGRGGCGTVPCNGVAGTPGCCCALQVCLLPATPDLSGWAVADFQPHSESVGALSIPLAPLHGQGPPLNEAPEVTRAFGCTRMPRWMPLTTPFPILFASRHKSLLERLRAPCGTCGVKRDGGAA